MSRDQWRQLLVVVAVVAMIVVNALSESLPINNVGTGEISDQFPIFFVPAGYVFSIWGLIYLGMVAYAIYQALPSQRSNPHLRAIGGWFVLSCAANIAWIFLWHYLQFPLTLVVMLVLLGSLIAIYRAQRAGGGTISTAERWAVRIPFSVYLGWISVATIANASQVLYQSHWGGLGIGDATWAVIMLGVATLLAGVMAIRQRDEAYLLVLVWAFVGIALKHAATPAVSIAAWVATALVAGMVGWSLVRRSRLVSR